MPNDSNRFLEQLQAQLTADDAADWRAGSTTVSILTDEQRGRLLLPSREVNGPGADERGLRSPEDATAPEPPPALDLRNVHGRSFISSVKDQQGCPSASAFALAGALEGSVRVLTDIAVNDRGGAALHDLSAAQLFYCCGSQCSGPVASLYGMMEYARKEGVAPEPCFPYTPGDHPCRICPTWQAQLTQPTLFIWLLDPVKMKAWLSARGPLISYMNVYTDFLHYKSGIYRHVSGALEGYQPVCIVGYDDSRRAWVCKNSWGTGWGEHGYFWIAYGQCAIDYETIVPLDFSRIYPLYDDFYMRGSLDDVGEFPERRETRGSSPDIIPVGAFPLSDPQLTLSGSWRLDLGKALLADQQNYIYVRAKNFKNAPNSGQTYLYYAPASLIPWPELWSRNALATQTGARQVDLKADTLGQVAVGADPFTWTPEHPPAHDPFSLIARTTTVGHPNPVPGRFSNMDDWVDFLHREPGFGWRAVSVITHDTPTSQYDVRLSVPEACRMAVTLSAHNIPPGCAMQFTCGTAGPRPLLNLNKTTIKSASMVAGVISDIPAGFDSAITVSFWKSGVPIPPDASLTLKAVYIPSPESPHAPKAQTLPLPGENPERGVLVGEFRTLIEAG
ncbi:C1 family peptidase [Yinghuangia seranimata]|uniref:C1 family peptidase n=1 Tax=Yinghuangia seranimata TaxID=408067 RepID=UPI00248CDD6E|nr:C1 family peptidase [Yinghuangia seranimata]MDI2128425.1 C1 family peptidase [Yinghuangia seranimata]